MLRLADGDVVLAAMDLSPLLSCRHLTQQRLAIVRGDRAKPRPVEDSHAQLILDRGEVHEREQLERLSLECVGHADLSTGEMPVAREARGTDFLLDDHRLNLTVSRAQCVATLVRSPALLDADCSTLHAMELLDGVRGFVEVAERAGDPARVA